MNNLILTLMGAFLLAAVMFSPAAAQDAACRTVEADKAEMLARNGVEPMYVLTGDDAYEFDAFMGGDSRRFPGEPSLVFYLKNGTGMYLVGIYIDDCFKAAVAVPVDLVESIMLKVLGQSV